MDWITLLGGTATAASGGVFGLLGATAGGDKQKEQTTLENEFELESINEEGSWNGLEASYGLKITDNNCSQWVNNLKALFRPMLTLLLTFASIVIIYWLLNKDQSVLTGVELNELLKYCIYSIVFSGATSITWWFGDRALSPPKHK